LKPEGKEIAVCREPFRLFALNCFSGGRRGPDAGRIVFLIFKGVIVLIISKMGQWLDSPSLIRNSSQISQKAPVAISAKFLNLNYLRQECFAAGLPWLYNSLPWPMLSIGEFAKMAGIVNCCSAFLFFM
jgi:hypothetical protein